MESESGFKPDLGDLAEVDRLVHEPARLMILMVLYTVEFADFTFLTTITRLTDGNLSSHLSKLESADYVEIEKGYAGKKPRTRIRLTEVGRKSVDAYRSTMSQALQYLVDWTVETDGDAKNEPVGGKHHLDVLIIKVPRLCQVFTGGKQMLLNFTIGNNMVSIPPRIWVKSHVMRRVEDARFRW
jgi:DNA-binding MarR family transcriptional regulator